MERDIGRVRLYAMRAVFFLTLIGLAPGAWQQILFSSQTWEPFYGVAISFWAALSALAVVGIFFPLKMLPLLLLQLLYKLVWLLGVAYPLWRQGLLEGPARELVMANGIGVCLDIWVVPWSYFAKHYFHKPAW